MNLVIDTNFIREIKELVNSAKQRVVTSINIAMVYTYYEIGRRIVEQEQKGSNKANYGEELLIQLSSELTKEFGKGYSLTNLKLIRQFYLVYSSQKSQTAFDQSKIIYNFKTKTLSYNNSKKQIQQTVFAKSKITNFKTKTPSYNNSKKQIGETVFLQSKIINNFNNYPITSDGHRFFLNWASYILLMRIKDPNERSFYEIECYNSRWSKRELKRQIDSCLYERLSLSRDKQGVLDLARRGHVIEKPIDVLKEPFVLEFLNLDEKESYSENDLETEILNKIQYFMLELGKGFTFVKRQMRLTFNNKHYHADLVFYNRFLRCFVIIDLKIGEVTHQDIGQMQMYVNYYDRFIKTIDENKTIGILLCKDKDDAIVRLTLPEDNNQIFAAKYETILPSKDELLNLIKETN